MEQLPIWFLVLALLLPRVSLVIGYFAGTLSPYHLGGFIPPTLAVFIPRVLVLVLIFQDRGMSGWLLVQGAALALVYIAVGSRD